MKDYSRIPDELKNQTQWVCAKTDSKAPMRADRMRGASTTDPSTWCDFDQAEWAVSKGYYDDIGYVFNDSGLVGIDIDCGYDSDGFITPLAVDIINTCSSYTEKSRSGRGVHILLKGSLPFSGVNNQKGVEIYKSGRYFIMTGKQVFYREMIENQKAIQYLIDKYLGSVRKDTINRNDYRKGTVYPLEYERPDIRKINIKPIYRRVGEGWRNISLASLAGQMHTIGYKPVDIKRELMKANKLFQPPLKDREIQAILESICRYER